MRLPGIRARRVRTALVLAVVGLALTATSAGATVAATGSMSTPRYGATATSITDATGAVTGILLAGGTDATGAVLASAELYSVATGTWTSAGSMSVGRSNPHSVQFPAQGRTFPKGGVLVEGGLTPGGLRTTATDIYDFNTNAWQTGGASTEARTNEALTLVGTQVLVTGGVNANGATISGSELFSPFSNNWTATGGMGTGRRDLAVAELPGNRVLATGGVDTKGGAVNTTEIFDLAAGTWAPAAPMAAARQGHTATAVGGGTGVLVTGGTDPGGTLSSAELYAVASGTWASAGTMAAARSGHQAVAITPSLVEVVGGTDPSVATSSAESWSTADGWDGPLGPGTVEPLDRDRKAAAVALISPAAGVLVAGGFTPGRLPAPTNTAITLFPTRGVTPTPAPSPTPAPTPTPTPTPTPPPTALVPVQGRSLVARPASGRVLIRIGTEPYRPLVVGELIPVGAYIDATLGHVTLVAAVGGVLQTAEFWGGKFQVTQPDGPGGLVVVRIVGKPVCSNGKTVQKSTRKATASKAAAKKKKVPPRIWGDGHGNFQTRGANSAATVRGTRWLVEERCTGTFTRVARGVVSVRDFVKHKTFLLPAPRSYLARPKG